MNEGPGTTLLGAPSDIKRAVANALRTVEASAMRLNELFRPFDSVLARRRPLPPDKAELVQRLTGRLRSRIAAAASSLKLQRIQQDGRLEAESLLALMKERLHFLDTVLDHAPNEDVTYISELAKDCNRLVDEIAVALGRNIPDAFLRDSDSTGGES